jgi:rod shape-determining protein MreC
MLLRPHYIALGIVFGLTVVLLSLPTRVTGRVRIIFGGLFLPLFGLAGSAHQLTSQASDSMASRGELLRELQDLRQENERLKIQAQGAAEMERENVRLRKLFGWQQSQHQWKLKLGKVVLRDPSNWWRTVQIDLGSRDGISNSLPVLTAQGLVGRIANVEATRSQVVLLGDPNCRVSAMVENEKRDLGIVSAGGPLETSLVDLGLLPRDARLKPGQNVVTSGQGGLFPASIPIGKILDWQPAEHGLNTVARVKLGADLDSLEEVWVLLR